jgi:hypothetical protein
VLDACQLTVGEQRSVVIRRLEDMCKRQRSAASKNAFVALSLVVVPVAVQIHANLAEISQLRLAAASTIRN